MTKVDLHCVGALPAKGAPGVIVAGKSGANPAIIQADPPAFAAPPLETQPFQAVLEAPPPNHQSRAGLPVQMKGPTVYLPDLASHAVYSQVRIEILVACTLDKE